MRYMFLVILMTAAMIGLITWATKPEVLAAQYHRVAAPIEDHFAQQRTAAWQAAKQQAWQAWNARVQLPRDCTHPATSLRKLECDNQLQLHADTFERDWNDRVASGWRPEGVN